MSTWGWTVVALALVAVPSTFGEGAGALRVEAGPRHIEDAAGRLVLFLRPGSNATVVVPYSVIVPEMTVCRGSIRVSFSLQTQADVEAFLLTSSVTQPMGSAAQPIAIGERRMNRGWDARIAVAVPADAPSGPRVLTITAQALPIDAAGCDLEGSSLLETRVVVLVVGRESTLAEARAMEVVVRHADSVGPLHPRETPAPSIFAAAVGVAAAAVAVRRRER